MNKNKKKINLEKNDKSSFKLIFNSILKFVLNNKNPIILLIIILLVSNYFLNQDDKVLDKTSLDSDFLKNFFDRVKWEKLNIQLIISEKNTSFLRKVFAYLLRFFRDFLLLDLLFFRGKNILSILGFFFSTEEKEKNSVSFKDIGGLIEAKEELGEIIDYFKNSEYFIEKGAKVPKGILLVGPPGNGKTLLAKALSEECKVNFIFRSASEFDEALVGVGARRVRDLFSEARSYEDGCIIFIDEIDSIGKKRYSHLNNSSDQTLNQLLSELDGFLSHEKIFVLAATNEVEVLDKALLRPGRFDRKIFISNPDFNGRKEIIKINTASKEFDNSVDFDELASMTRGFSGAEVVSMINEALIISIRSGKSLIDQDSLLEALDRVIMGPALKSRTPSLKSRKITAYHEAGHAVVALSLPETIVKKITITARWNAGGYTWVDFYNSERSGDDDFLNKKQILSNVMSLLGGRLSEEIIFGVENITSGAYSDFKKITSLIDDLIIRYSMTNIGVVLSGHSDYSQKLSNSTRKKIEEERERIIRICKIRVKKILLEKREILDLFANILLDRNTIQGEDVNYIFVNRISPYLKFLN